MPAAQRFALPALGRAAERRSTGKMLRRRKRLGIAPESPASGARCVGLQWNIMNFYTEQRELQKFLLRECFAFQFPMSFALPIRKARL